MREIQNTFIQCLMNIREGLRSKPKPVDVTVEKQDAQESVGPVAPTRFGIRTVAGRYEITKPPDDFLG
ncbi:hypothetical protein KKE48_03165 [Patescibacteria group bacterium]|nr:hypothetical protein [Patescibacteria group bacterium]MBU1499842.1 hypothetical protein [Patescibacteria group bacterium]